MKQNSIFDDRTLAFCLLLPTFLLYSDIPLWAFATALFFWFYRLTLDRSGWRIPSRFITGMFSTIILLVTYYSYKTLIGREVSSAFLVVILSLKVLEYRDAKENGFLILLGLYLYVAKFLFDSQLVLFSMSFPAMIVLLYYLMPVSFRFKNNRAAGLFLFRSLIMAAPLAAFLFFYFPRVSGSFLFPETQGKQGGKVGFATDIAPGSVASLSQSDEIAFRAEFSGQQASTNSLYWRGMTLTISEGMAWKQDRQLEAKEIVYSLIDRNEPHVQVILEPTYQPWLFSLDQTTALTMEQKTVLKNPLGSYKTDSSNDKRAIYRLKTEQKLTRPRDIAEKPIQIKELPSPELKRLLLEFSKGSPKPDELLNRISEFYMKNRFQYSLNPGDSGKLTLEAFLLKTRIGFCEHFASATALLLNYLKVPARVVVGYQGGDFNPVGRFWTIRQRDAHAWIEYIDETNQWHRFDPTAVIAPMRLALGAGLFEQFKEDAIDLEQLKALASNNHPATLIDRIEFFFENANYRWNSWFVSFDIDRQKQLLEQMDINLGLAIMLGMFLTLILSMMMSWLLRTRMKIPRSQRIFNQLNKTMALYNLEINPGEGPIAWKQRLLEELPQKRRVLEEIFTYYINEAYANKQSPDNWVKAKKVLKSF